MTMKRKWQMVGVAVSGGFCGLLMAVGCTVYHQRHVRSTPDFTPLHIPGAELQLYQGDLPDTETQGDDRHWLQCITNTGGTCNWFGCSGDRGPTNCQWFDFGYHCVCQPGNCANLAGRCESSPNQVINASVVFENVQWPGWYLAAGDHTWTLWVQQDINANSKWNVLQTPEGDLMLGNVKYPSYVATTESFQSCSQCTDNDGNSYDCNCETSYRANLQQVKKQDLSNFVRLEKASWPGAVSIYAVQQPMMYWYATKLGSSVLAGYGQQGPQGWWTMKDASSLDTIQRA